MYTYQGLWTLFKTYVQQMQCLEKNAYNQIWRYTHWQWLFKNNLHLSSWCRSASHACCTVVCSVLEPGTIHGSQRFLTCSAWLDLGLSLVLTDSWLVCLPSWVGSLLSSISELVKRIGLELAQLKKKKKKRKVFCVVLVTLLSCLLSLYPSSIQFAYIHLHF